MVFDIDKLKLAGELIFGILGSIVRLAEIILLIAVFKYGVILSGSYALNVFTYVLTVAGIAIIVLPYTYRLGGVAGGMYGSVSKTKFYLINGFIALIGGAGSGLVSMFAQQFAIVAISTMKN